ncbi:MAG: ornithine cyclodeaminase family protein [Nitrososphaerales archaeon]
MRPELAGPAGAMVDYTYGEHLEPNGRIRMNEGIPGHDSVPQAHRSRRFDRASRNAGTGGRNAPSYRCNVGPPAQHAARRNDFMPLWLNAHDTEVLLTMEEAIAAVEEAFRQLARGNAVMPQRLGIGLPQYGGGGAVMPAFVGGTIDCLGLKLVTLFPGNPGRSGLPAIQASLLLLDPHTGQLLAIMDAAVLTALRTAAVSGVATRYLARAEASTAVIFGAGVQGRTQLAALCAMRPVRQAWVIDPRAGAAESFAADMSNRLGLEVTCTEDIRAAVAAANVIVTATTSHEPLFDGQWLRPGVHINAIGSHSPNARELDTVTVERALVVVDQTSACLAEAGDLMIPIREGAFAESGIHAELGEVIIGARPGRTHDHQITLFKSVGLAIQDVAAAAAVYGKAQRTGRGQLLLG